MAETLGKVHTRRRALFQGQWWRVRPKLVFNQMAAPVPEIMDKVWFAYGLCSKVTTLCSARFKTRLKILLSWGGGEDTSTECLKLLKEVHSDVMSCKQASEWHKQFMEG
jgi:hypothetical protein